MAKNSFVVDVKPVNELVEDTKPTNLVVFDTKPNNLEVNADPGADQLYTQILTVGMYMGIPPFTYPEAGTVSSPFNP